MIKTLSNIFKQDKEKFVIPRSVQQVIPIETSVRGILNREK